MAKAKVRMRMRMGRMETPYERREDQGRATQARSVANKIPN